MAEYVEVGSVDNLPAGRSGGYKVAGESVALFNLGDELIAVENRCPHQGAPLAGAPIMSGGRVRCMLHGWIFKLKACEEDDELKRYPVMIERGKIYICPEPLPRDHVFL